MIFCDLDQTLANLEKRIHPNEPTDEFFDSDAYYTMVVEHALYRKLQPMPDFQLMKDFLSTKNHSYLSHVGQKHYIRILSDKQLWTNNYLGFGKRVYGTRIQEDKIIHCKRMLDLAIKPTLIDDSEYNCELWDKAGGYAILHTSAENTIRSYNELHRT